MVTQNKIGIVTDIKKAMAEVTGLGIEQMGICDIYNHKIFKILPESHPVKLIKENDDIFWLVFYLSLSLSHILIIIFFIILALR